MDAAKDPASDDGVDDAPGSGAEEPLEASVKGIAQGIVGKLKEVAGELIGDEDLERDGIVEQLDGKIRRAQP